MWTLSLVLAVGAIAIMLSLVILRLRDERRDRETVKSRKMLRLAFIAFGADKDRRQLHTVMVGAAPQLVIDVSYEFLDLVRGEEKQQLEAELMMTLLPKLLRQTIAKGNEAKRIEAARQIASFKSYETVDCLKQALRDRSPAVRLSAAISLGKMREVFDLAEILETVGPEACRSKEIYHLLKTVQQEDADILRTMGVDSAADVNLRAAAIHALADLGDYAYLPCFEGLARDENPGVAIAALNALGKFAHPATSKTVAFCMANPSWEVRTAAARVAGLMGAGDTTLRLADLVDDTEWSVRYAAASSLLAMGNPGITLLKKLAGGSASNKQSTASLVLEEAVSA